MACIKWPQPFANLFWVKCHPSKALPQIKPRQEPQNRPSFLPTIKPHPLNPLTEGPPPLYWLGTSRWCFSPYVSFTILIIYLLLLPQHSCRSCLVSVYCVCWACAYLPWREGCMGFWACIASLTFLKDLVISGQKFLPFQPTELLFLSFLFQLHLWACWLSFLPCWPIGFITSFLGLPRPIYFAFTSYYARGLIGCYSCHAGPLSLLPLFLDFSAHLFCLYLLLCPWAYWLSFLPRWAIRLMTSSLGLPQLIYSTFTPYFMGLLTITPITLAHWIYYLTFTTYTLFSSHFPYFWASSAIGPFGKNRHQQFVLENVVHILSHICYKTLLVMNSS